MVSYCQAAYTLTYNLVRNRFNVDEIPFEAKPIREQKALFYAKAVPFKILSITAPTDAS